MKTHPENQKLLELIEDARTGKLVLPVFQRNFVWSRDEITALLVSLLEGHYIGSLLLLDTDSQAIPFAYRTLQGVDINGPAQPYAMILDGQQRLTSLHYAFAAPNIPLRWTTYAYQFFLDLNKVTAGDIQNAIISERSDYTAKMLDLTTQFETLIVPLTQIESWNDWLNQYERWLVARDRDAYFSKYFDKDKPAWTDVLDRLKGFQVPTIRLPRIQPNDARGLSEVCTIFEKINSMGVKLSVYDLLTARLYKDHVDLRALWEKAVDDHDKLDDYSEGKSDEFGVYVLRTIAMVRGLDVRSRNLINLEPENFEADWKTAVKYMEKALKRMTSTGQDGFGAFDRKWLPYVTMVSPLAAMLWYIDKHKLDNLAYSLVKRWYWSAVFTERYAGSVESTTTRDFQDFQRASRDPSYEMDSIRDARINVVENQAFSLRNVSRLNSLYRGVICLVAMHGAKDFISGDAIEFHELEDHHIFPANYLQKHPRPNGKKYESTEINCVINRTLISERTNRVISDLSPKDYTERLMPAVRSMILDTHMIPSSAQTAMQANDYDAFLQARERVLIANIISRISI